MGWLSGWAKRVEVTPDKNDIDALLTHFPVTLKIGASVGRNGQDITFVFDELESDANRKKIALTKADGTTQLYAEIVKWDHAGEFAELHVSRSGWEISSTVDTPFYLYYDKTHADNTDYVGDPSDVVVHNVWNANFKVVTHMRDDPDTSHIRDSTVNANDGTKIGAGEPAVTVAGKIDDAQDWDGIDDGIAIPHSAELASMTNITLEVWIKANAVQPDTFSTILRRDGGTAPRTFYLMDLDSGYLRLFFMGSASADMTTGVSVTTDLRDGAFHHVVVVRDNSGGKAYGYVDNAKEIDVDDIADGDFISNPTEPVDIGYWAITTERRFKGTIDEIRISSIARTSAWIKASYESQRDHLLAFGSEETALIEKDFSDVGSGSEAFGIPLKALPFSEVGNGAEVFGVFQNKAVVDVGGGVEVFETPFRAMGFSEQGLGSDVFSKIVTSLKISFSDVGLGSDVFETSYKEMKFVTVGQGIDVFNIPFKAAKFLDTGFGTDVFNLLVKIAFNDVASGTDLFQKQLIEIITKEFSDSGLGTDVFQTLFRTMKFIEVGEGIDIFLTPYREMIFIDVGTGIDTFYDTINHLAFNDSGLGSDAFEKIIGLTVTLPKILINTEGGILVNVGKKTFFITTQDLKIKTSEMVLQEIG